jgi:DNA-binding transcriptional ArsR family regulator
VFRVDERKTALIFKAFCDENRIRILRMLKSGEKCACKILEELNITQPTLSHHMRILCDSGIVISRKEGKWMHYSISRDGAKVATDLLNDLTAAQSGCTDKSCCEK